MRDVGWGRVFWAFGRAYTGPAADEYPRFNVEFEGWTLFDKSSVIRGKIMEFGKALEKQQLELRRLYDLQAPALALPDRRTVLAGLWPEVNGDAPPATSPYLAAFYADGWATAVAIP